MGVRMCFQVPVEDRGIGSPGVGIMGSCGPSSMGAGSWAPVLCRSSTLNSWAVPPALNLLNHRKLKHMGGEQQRQEELTEVWELKINHLQHGCLIGEAARGLWRGTGRAFHLPLRTRHGVSLSTGIRRRLKTGHPLDVCSLSAPSLLGSPTISGCLGPKPAILYPP